MADLVVQFNSDRNSIWETILRHNGTVPEGFFTHNFLYLGILSRLQTLDLLPPIPITAGFKKRI